MDVGVACSAPVNVILNSRLVSNSEVLIMIGCWWCGRVVVQLGLMVRLCRPASRLTEVLGCCVVLGVVGAARGLDRGDTVCLVLSCSEEEVGSAE